MDINLPIAFLDLLLEVGEFVVDAVGEVLADVDWEILLGTGGAAAGAALLGIGVYFVYDELDKQKLLEKLPTLIAKDKTCKSILQQKLQSGNVKKISREDLLARVRNISRNMDGDQAVSVVEVEVTNKATGATGTIKVGAKQLSSDLRPGAVLIQ